MLVGTKEKNDESLIVAVLPDRNRIRRIANAKGERLPEEVKGTHHTKALPVDANAQKRILDARAQKKVYRVTLRVETSANFVLSVSES